MPVICFAGPAKSGKSEICKYLTENHNAIEVPFAKPLKDFAAEISGVRRELFDDPVLKDMMFPAIGMTLREYTCNVSDLLQKHFGVAIVPTRWVETVSSLLAISQLAIGSEPLIVAPDLRVKDASDPVKLELRAAEHVGAFIIYVERPGVEPPSVGSRWEGFNKADAHMVIRNDGTIEQLHEKVRIALSLLSDKQTDIKVQ